MSSSRKETILKIPQPKACRGVLRGRRLLLPLDSELCRNGLAPICQHLKKAFKSAPALALPDLSNFFQLYVAEVWGIAKGVLTQAHGKDLWPIYLKDGAM